VPRSDHGRSEAAGPAPVLKTDNTPRVRDRYVSLSTSGYARALATRTEARICRPNVPANDRTCPPFPPQNFHGKEGVDGSSPSEWFSQKPCKWAYSVACFDENCSLRGYETGTFWDWRTTAGTGGVSRHSLKRARDTRPRPLTRKAPAKKPSALPAPTRRVRSGDRQPEAA
jgi:hypothetical protein